MKISLTKRILVTYKILGSTFGTWIVPIFVAIYLIFIRTISFLFSILDYIFIPSIWTKKVEKPIIVVGNPRSGTTFLQRFLVSNGFGTGTQLWQMIYPSVILQKIIRPILPVEGQVLAR